MVINKLNELLPKIKIKLSTERSFDQQWRDYLLNPTLESPLKKEINNQITDLIFSSIIEEKHKLAELMFALAALKEQDTLIQQPLLEREDPNSTGSIKSTLANDILYYEYTMVLILAIIETLLKEIENQINTLTVLDQELGTRINLLDEMMQSQFMKIITEFSDECEGILLGTHPRFAELLHAFSFDEMEHTIFHGELGNLIAKLHRDERGIEPHESIVHSIRERVVYRADQVRQLGRERKELVERKEMVCRNLEECRRLAQEARTLQHAAQSGRPGDEVALARSVESIHQRFHPIPQFSSACRKKDEDEKEHDHRFQKRV